MATSLYGTVKKVNSTSFTFDKIYSSRAEMELAMTNDGIYHGRYVLVSYGDKFGTNNSMANTSIEVTLPSYNSDPPVDGITYTTNLNTSWLANYNRDLNKYQNIYDKTVWQKVFEGDTAKYIMVAQLNARAPAFTINKDYYSFQLRNAETGETGKSYYIKGEANPRTQIAEYPIPKWHETYSNDLIYHLEMPMPLRLNLAETPEYFAAGFNPIIHTGTAASRTANIAVANNYIHWDHILDTQDNSKVTGADFNLHMPIIGQTISDMYDVLYGIPATSGTNRPTNPTSDNIADAINQTAGIGLIGILRNLNLQNTTYYFHGDWNAASNQFGHIENKPILITGVTIGENTHKLVFETNVAAS